MACTMDDPVKGRKEASSRLIRDVNEIGLSTRFDANAGMYQQSPFITGSVIPIEKRADLDQAGHQTHGALYRQSRDGNSGKR